MIIHVLNYKDGGSNIQPDHTHFLYVIDIPQEGTGVGFLYVIDDKASIYSISFVYRLMTRTWVHMESGL